MAGVVKFKRIYVDADDDSFYDGLSTTTAAMEQTGA